MSLSYYDLSKELAYVRGQLYDSEKDRVRLIEENKRLREALEEIAKSSSGCECCTEGALNREELGDAARWALKENK